jgi:hypothetical protein
MRIIGGVRGHNFDSCYWVAYGADHIQIERPASDTREISNIRMPNALFEGYGNRSEVRFVPGNASQTLRDFTLTSWNIRTKTAAFSLEIAGASSKVRLFSSTINIVSASSPTTPVMFADESRWELYDSYIGSWTSVSHSPQNHAVFRGREFVHQTGVLENWAMDLVGDLDWRVSTLTRTRLNSRNSSGAALGFMQFDHSSNAWQFSNDGTNINLNLTDTAMYPSSDNSDQLGLSNRRWSTVHGVNVLAAGRFGYATGQGAGGTVTQLTDKTTAVTLNTRTGLVTLAASSIAAGATVSFIVNSTEVGATSFIAAMADTPAANYNVWASRVGLGQLRIFVQNITGSALAQSFPVRFIIFDAAST